MFGSRMLEICHRTVIVVWKCTRVKATCLKKSQRQPLFKLAQTFNGDHDVDIIGGWLEIDLHL